MAGKSVICLQQILMPFGTVGSSAIDSTAITFDVGNATLVSLHVVWGAPSGAPASCVNLATGTSINANFTVKTSNIKLGANLAPILWVAKTGGALNVTSTSGQNSFSFNVDVTERYYSIFWDAGGVTAGTVACYALAKG